MGENPTPQRLNPLRNLIPDPFILALIATVALASLLPASGPTAEYLGYIATAAVVVLFFLHGVRLPRENLVAALVHWRLHGAILATTFAVFPLLALAMRFIWPSLLPPDLWVGLLFLATLPSTVQTSIAFTSLAKGNVAASVTSAAASNLLGIALTPLLAGLLLHAQGSSVPASGVWKIALQLLLPFVVGHLLRPLLANWALRQKLMISISDRATILISVYSAFSAAVMGGIWTRVPVVTLLTLIGVCATLLMAVVLLTLQAARWFAFTPEDGRAMLFCGSLKSLVSGVPMARVLFTPVEMGAVLLPVMIFHQLQLMICASIARRGQTP
jgi:solute carrier family 10 (sodium/bile acid cotransporter), member 7